MADIITLSSSDDESSAPAPRKKIRPNILHNLLSSQVTIIKVNKKNNVPKFSSNAVIHEVSSDDEEIVTLTNEKNEEIIVLENTENGNEIEAYEIVDVEKKEDAEVVDKTHIAAHFHEISNGKSSGDDSDKEESSGKENNNKNESHHSKPSTSISHDTFPNTILLAEFLSICEETFTSKKYDILKSKIVSVRKHYRKFEMELGDLSDFKKVIESAIFKIKKSPLQAVLAFNELYQYLRDYRQAGTVEVEPEHRVQLKKLEKTIGLLVAKIKSLEEAEVNFEDEEDSAYLQIERYQNRLIKVHHKYCERLNKNPYSGRLTYTKLDFSHSEYDEINRAISKKYKNNKFPSCFEMEVFIKKVVKDNNMELSESKIKSESVHCFKKLGELLQNRRKRELYDSHYTLLKDNEDPAKTDSTLNMILAKNYEEGQDKIEKIIQEYANKQQHGDEVDSSEEDSEKSASEEDSEKSASEEDEDIEKKDEEVEKKHEEVEKKDEEVEEKNENN